MTEVLHQWPGLVVLPIPETPSNLSDRWCSTKTTASVFSAPTAFSFRHANPYRYTNHSSGKAVAHIPAVMVEAWPIPILSMTYNDSNARGTHQPAREVRNCAQRRPISGIDIGQQCRARDHCVSVHVSVSKGCVLYSMSHPYAITNTHIERRSGKETMSQTFSMSKTYISCRRFFAMFNHEICYSRLSVPNE